MWNGLACRLNTAGNALLFSTYLGGNIDDMGYSIAVDSVGAAYVTGTTSSTTFPTASPLQPTSTGGGDVFVVKIGDSASSSTTYDETYSYDAIGNLLTKAGVAYTYGASGAGTGAGPHQARNVGGQA